MKRNTKRKSRSRSFRWLLPDVDGERWPGSQREQREHERQSNLESIALADRLAMGGI
jgi:hypothetical protein